jgi:hypothetical protein
MGGSSFISFAYTGAVRMPVGMGKGLGWQEIVQFSNPPGPNRNVDFLILFLLVWET